MLEKKSNNLKINTKSEMSSIIPRTETPNTAAEATL
jgi:hypothetical protein